MLLQRIGRGSARHGWWVVGIWVVVIVGLSLLLSRTSHSTRDVFTVPGSESQEALDLTEENFPDFANASATVVFQATSGTVDDSTNSAAIEQTVKDLEGISGVNRVTDPTKVPFDIVQVSSDKTVAYATVSFDQAIQDLRATAFSDIEGAASAAVDAGLNVQYGGQVVDTDNPPKGGLSDYSAEIGLTMAIIILLISLGAVVAAGLPITTAVVALLMSITILGLTEHVVTIGSLNQELGTMIGLGVGIDYSLLIVNRYREIRASGTSTHDGVGQAIGTAGRSVLFAGITVIIATLALALVGIPYMTSLGLTAAGFVAMTVVAALTLLPAMLGLLGDHVNALRMPWARRSTSGAPVDGFWARWARTGAAHPWRLALVALAALAVLAIPSFSSQLGIIDDGDAPSSTTQRKAYDIRAEAFGPGINGQLLVLTELDASGGDEELEALAALEEAMSQASGVQSVTPPIPDSDDTAAIYIVTPTTGPSDEKTTDLVKDLRSSVLPDAVSGTPISSSDVLVGGSTAGFIDFTDRIVARLPLFIAAVLGASFLLLMMVFRSILVPLKAALLSLLSFLVGYGITVAVFQWGWLKDVIGLEQTVPIEAFAPLMLFAILFGLSTDYEVFLVSRIREEFVRTGDAHGSIVTGLSLTAKVIVSAALIMASVFLAFVTNPAAAVKQIGFGLAIAVLFDAFVVRLIVVPSILHLMGRSAWWFPRWLDRIVPEISLE